MSDLLKILLLMGLVAAVFSPIYFMRRKQWRLAGEDLKKIDREDWEKQQRFGVLTRLISRSVIGGILLIVSIINIGEYTRGGGYLPVYLIIAGVLLVSWGLFDFWRNIGVLRSPEKR